MTRIFTVRVFSFPQRMFGVEIVARIRCGSRFDVKTAPDKSDAVSCFC